MQKRTIDPYEYASTITAANPGGILFTTKRGDEVDTMVIGWGLIGNIWGKPTFTAFVRESRHSHTLVEETGEFTVNAPVGKLDKRIFKVAGSQSGRDIDKVKELGLTLVEPEMVAAPALAECPITLECKVMYKQLLDEADIPAGVMKSFYPAVDGKTDMHVAYYGEIVASYIVEE
ncbi:MAG: flavin reductase family protein [Coriobacteriia bacterium]|nr:flavin reductase family protein [Coriobacteriia bacterium]